MQCCQAGGVGGFQERTKSAGFIITERSALEGARGAMEKEGEENFRGNYMKSAEYEECLDIRYCGHVPRLGK